MEDVPASRIEVVFLKKEPIFRALSCARFPFEEIKGVY